MSNKGFTLIELLISIFIIIIGIGGAYLAIDKTLSSISNQSSQLIAISLAQEGVEIARNIRDSNFLEGDIWDDGLGNGDYEAAYSDVSLTNCAGSCNFDDLRFLKIDANGFYSYSSGSSESKFKRKITTGFDAPEKTRVSVEVYWENPTGLIQTVSAHEILYNWIE